MKHVCGQLRWFIICCSICFRAASQAPETGLTARELYFSPEVEVPAPNPMSKPVANTKPKPKAKAKQEVKSHPKSDVTNPSKPAAEQAQGDLVPVSNRQPAPLGLRYTVSKQSNKSWENIDPTAVFHTGDRIRLSVEVNDDGYLYVVHQGATGSWLPMYPAAGRPTSENRVLKNHAYQIPPDGMFKFDEAAGKERLFLVVSRQPERSLDDLMHVLRTGGTSAPATPADKDRTLIASRIPSISDSVIGQMRQTYARDLVIEQVNEPPDAAKPNSVKEVYAVNPHRAPDARVVADIALIHQ